MLLTALLSVSAAGYTDLHCPVAGFVWMCTVRVGEARGQLLGLHQGVL